LVVGDDLHGSKNVVSTNLARRYALLYNVDISGVDPCFSIPDPNISGKLRDTAIKEEDIVKFLAKGGNYYTILEMPDTELAFRKIPNGDKLSVIKLYRSATKEYFKDIRAQINKSEDKETTYNEFIQRKRLNPLTLNVYIRKVMSANVPQSQLYHYIDSLNILPDFLDVNWPFNQKYLEDQFVKKTGIPVEEFLTGAKRDLYMNVAKPTSFL